MQTPGILRLVLTCIGLALCPNAGADEELWRTLAQGGVVLMVRHALAPGTGDPPSFKLGDCATQRNLSAAGREEASRIGRALRARKVPIGPVYASEWCRTRETAEIAFGRYQPWPALNSFFSDRSTQAAQTRAVIERARALAPGSNLILVTHQVNITAVSGVFPAPSEIVLLKPAGNRLELVGRLRIAGAGG